MLSTPLQLEMVACQETVVPITAMLAVFTLLLLMV